MLEVRRIVNSIFTSNTYVVFDDEYDYCWLIDIGDFQQVANVLPPDIEIRGVLLTHTHFDHIYGINTLHKAYPKCRIYTSIYGRGALFNDKKNLSYYHEASITYEGKDVVIMTDGEKLELYPNVFITAYVTPGHCSSCMTFGIGDWLFTGDSYIPGVKVVTKLPKGNQTLAKKSIERILSLAEGKEICPGHGTMQTKNTDANYLSSDMR